MKNLITALSLMLFAGNAFAVEFPAWILQEIKNENPNELVYRIFIGGDKCPVSIEEIAETIEGVFIRSRVKPLNFSDIAVRPDLFLYLHITCGDLDANLKTFNLAASFGRDGMLYTFHFNVLGYGPPEKLLQGLKNVVEMPMTAYIKANFDL